MNDLEEERLGVAELHLQRLVSTYKSKQRKGKELKRLKLFEEALALLAVARLL